VTLWTRPDVFEVGWRLNAMPEKIGDVGEFGLIRRIDALLKREGVKSERVSLGIGDDTASFLPRPGYEVLVTCDSMVEDRHYLSRYITPFDLGRRAMASNISDIGAMGGTPLYALVSLGLKAEMPVRDVEDMYRGFLAELNPFGASVIGGNLTRSGNGMFIDITLLGEVREGSGVRRSGARDGDAILVTGYPGQAAAGLQLLLHAPDDAALLRHPLVRIYNTPSHRARLGQAVALSGYATAMIDTSDGFLGDLGHICEESGVGAEILEGKIPVSKDVQDAAVLLGRDPHDFCLGESDDYELIITCRPERVDPLRSLGAECCGSLLTEVGRITVPGRGVTVVMPDGKTRPTKPLSWDHFVST
jgi:thiamine-monophosphate kinase